MKKYVWASEQTPNNELNELQLEELKKYQEFGSPEDVKLMFEAYKDLERKIIQYEEIGTIDELKDLKEIKDKTTDILRTHRFSDNQCIEKLSSLVGVSIKV